MAQLHLRLKGVAAVHQPGTTHHHVHANIEAADVLRLAVEVLAGFVLASAAQVVARLRPAYRATLDGLGIDPVETGIQTPPPATWWMYPRGWQLVFVEYLKLIYYLCRSL